MGTKRVKGIVVEIGGNTTKLNKALDGTNKHLGSTQASLKDIERLLKLDPTNTQLLEQKQRLLSDAVSDTKEKLDVLKTAEKQVQEQFAKGEISQERYDELQREIITTEQQMDSLKTKTKEFGSVGAQQVAYVGEKFEEAGKKIDDVGEKISNAGDKMLPVTTAVIAGGTACVTTADSMETAVNQFLAATGTAAKGVEALADGTRVAVDNTEKFKDVIDAIYSNNYGESFEDIAQAMATVKSNLSNIDDSQLQEVTESAIALRDTFDMDVSESVRAVNSLMDQFGVTADEAYSLIVQGAQKGLNQNGDLLDVVNEYAVQFKSIGYDAEDMFNMLANGAEEGTWSIDKLGDAVKEFNIRMTDGSAKEAVEALGFSWEKVSESWQAGGEDAREILEILMYELQYSERTVNGYSVGVGLLGTMFEDMGYDAVLALSNTNGEISKTNAAMEALKQQRYDDLTSQLQQLGRTFTSDIAVPIGERLIPIISEIIEKVSDWIEEFGELSEEGQKTTIIIGAIVAAIGPALKILGAITTVFGKIVSSLSGVADVVGTCCTGISKSLSWISETVLPAFKTAFSVTMSSIRTAVGSVVNWTTGTAVPALKSGFITAMNAISSAVNTAFSWITGTALPALKTGFVTAMNAISSAVNMAFTWITQTALPALQNAFSSVFGFIAANPVVLLIAAIVGLVALVATKGDEMQALLQKFDDWLQGVFATDWTKIFGPVLGGALNKFFSTAKGIWDSLKQILDGLIDFIRGVFTGDWKRAWSGVVSIFSGIFNGIKSVAKGPINAVISLINRAISGINYVINTINKIPGVSIPNVGRIAMLAKGGTLYSGDAIVGENGPELLTVSGGKAVVRPLGNSSTTHNTANFGGTTINVYAQPGQDVHEFAHEVAEIIHDDAKRKAAVFSDD